jgi:hypothetical protein
MIIKPSRFKVWCRRCFYVLAVVIALCLLVAGYLYLQLTAAVQVLDSPAIKLTETSEVKRKLTLFEEGRKIGRKGFIHLSQGEINAYLEEYLGEKASKADTNAPVGRCQLLKTRVFLTPDGFIWACWIQTTWKKWSRPVVWQRVFDLVREANRWDVRLKSMYVGRMEIPAKYWSSAERFLGEVDSGFSEKYQWLSQLPAMEIKTNMSLKLELKLYNYSDSNVLKEAQR